MANTAPTRTLSSGDFAFSTFSATIPFSSLKNAVALTTAFTYDSDCLGRWLLSSSRSGETPNIYSLSPTGTNTDPRWTSCQPFNYQSAYSPGMCPEGRTIASVIEAQYTAGNQKNIEWAGLCCESGFEYDGGLICSKNISTPVRVFVPFTSTYLSRITAGSGVTSAVTTTYEEFFPTDVNDISYTGDAPQGVEWYTTSSSTTTISAAEALAEALVVLWQSSDLSKFPPAYATSLAKRIGVQYTATSGPTSEVSTQAFVPSKGLSTGAKAGIGVGVSVFAIFVISLVAFLILRRRSRNRKEFSVDQPEFVSRSS